MATLVGKSPEENQKEFDSAKRRIADLLRKGYQGTIDEWIVKLGHKCDTMDKRIKAEMLVGSSLADLEYEGKASLCRKTIYDSEEGRIGYPIIIGVYGPPKPKTSEPLSATSDNTSKFVLK